MAQQAGLDLLEISGESSPPVCKIIDYGKYKYELQKKEKEAKKKQKTIDIKELKIRPNIEEHDYQVKIKAAHRFIEEGNKVKFQLQFRGREMSNLEPAKALFERITTDLGDTVKREQLPKLEGRHMIMIVCPAGK